MSIMSDTYVIKTGSVYDIHTRHQSESWFPYMLLNLAQRHKMSVFELLSHPDEFGPSTTSVSEDDAIYIADASSCNSEGLRRFAGDFVFLIDKDTKTVYYRDRKARKWVSSEEWQR